MARGFFCPSQYHIWFQAQTNQSWNSYFCSSLLNYFQATKKRWNVLLVKSLIGPVIRYFRLNRSSCFPSTQVYNSLIGEMGRRAEILDFRVSYVPYIWYQLLLGLLKTKAACKNQLRTTWTWYTPIFSGSQNVPEDPEADSSRSIACLQRLRSVILCDIERDDFPSQWRIYLPE